MELVIKGPATGLPDDLTTLDPTTTGRLVGKTKAMTKTGGVGREIGGNKTQYQI